MAVFTPEEEEFLRDNIFCILSTIKKGGAPQSTPVFYLYEDDKIYITVTKTRVKTRNVLRDPRVSLVVLQTERPYPYIQINGVASITEEELEPRSRRIFSRFSPAIPENFSDMLKEQQRQIMVVVPERAVSNLSVQRATGSRS